MNDWQTVQKIKRATITRLKRKLRPHLWPSDYNGVLVFSFATKRSSGRRGYVITRSIRNATSDDLKCFMGFYSAGIFDAFGGGMKLIPFETLSVEDLLRLELWLQKNFDREKSLVQAAKAKLASD